MADIYRNSTLKIAGPAAADSHAGFLHDKSPPTLKPCPIPYYNSRGLESGVITISYADVEREPQWNWERRNVLATRGWVLQERLLSPRVLYFGSEKMYWECMIHYRHDNLHLPMYQRNIFGLSVSKISFDGLSKSSMLGYWYDVIRTYSKCSLSVSTDKLPTLSGIAREFSKRLQDTYCAGIWSSDIHNGLSWVIKKRRVGQIQRHGGNTSYRAPSWSWASIDDPVVFSTQRPRNSIQGHLQTLQRDVENIEILVQTRGLDDFGQILSASLTMTWCIKRGFLQKVVEERGLFSRDVLELRDPELEGVVAEFFPDDSGFIGQFHEDAHGCLVKMDVWCLLLGYCDQSSFNALAVVPTTLERRQYRRVGILQCWSLWCRAGVGWFNDCEREVLQLV
jgi:hypothetical protein